MWKQIVVAGLAICILNKYAEENSEVRALQEKPAKTNSVSLLTPAPKNPQRGSARVIQSCPDSGIPGASILGQYNPETHEIKMCLKAINASAQRYRVSPEAGFAYTLAHEQAHSKGERTEAGADKTAVDQMIAEGNWEAVIFRGSSSNRGNEYEAGSNYARAKLKENGIIP